MELPLLYIIRLVNGFLTTVDGEEILLLLLTIGNYETL